MKNKFVLRNITEKFIQNNTRKYDQQEFASNFLKKSVDFSIINF